MAEPLSETRLIAQLAKRFRSDSHALVGIGDDAAVLSPLRGRCVWTVDAQVEGVHFRRSWVSFFDIGARSFHAAVSDLAAMGAKPIAALSSLVVPPSVTFAQLDELAKGQALAARQLGCPVVGGNVSRGRELSVTTSALGSVEGPLLTRSGARASDGLFLIGDVGLAAAGLAFLTQGRKRPTPEIRCCLEAFRRPRALIAEGRAIAKRATAAIDVSDGLAGDAARISAKSRVRVVFDARALRKALRAELAFAAERLGYEPLQLALHGGEDYALLFTAPPRARFARAHRIGRVEPGRGVYLETEGSGRQRLAGGFDHLRGAPLLAGHRHRRAP